MTLIHSFPPIADASARILILGSMPGEESLRAQQYYAHPRNAFWRLMGDLFDAGPELPYGKRTQQLKKAGVALWDVLASCMRKGSLDSAIAADSIIANDFQAFFASHRNITRVFFNGTKAEHSFRKHVLPTLTAQPLQFTRLPSTSPAHAARSHAQKRTEWQIITRQ
jgi:hypoxanthine-DNA glycosylase